MDGKRYTFNILRSRRLRLKLEHINKLTISTLQTHIDNMFWFGIDPSRVKLHGSFIVRALIQKKVCNLLPPLPFSKF